MLPTAAPTHLDRARELLRLEKFDLALQAAQEAAAADPNSADPHTLTGWILRRMRRLADAEAAVRHGLKLEPTDGDAQHALAVILWERGHAVKAEEAFKTAIATGAWNSWLYLSNYARFLVARSRAAEALVVADEAVNRLPHDETPHESRGMALHALGRYAEAELALREALRIDPQSALALEYLGKVALATGQFNEAAELFRAQLRLTPSDMDGRRGLITALKARYPIYGLVLLLAQRTTTARARRFLWWYWIAIAALILGGVFVSTISDPLGKTIAFGAVPLIYIALIGWLVRLIWRWVGEPIFNTLLRMDPASRAVIEYDSADAIVSGGLAYGLLLGTALLANGLVRGLPNTASQVFGALFFLLGLTLLAVGSLRIYRRQWLRRTIIASYVSVLAGGFLLTAALIVTGSYTAGARSLIGGFGLVVGLLCGNVLFGLRVFGVLLAIIARLGAKRGG